jgi:saccharopine dehydrogenase-like NADP-dependent oxidoreductase
MKNVLLLGAGLVSAPLIRYFGARRGYRLAVISTDLQRARTVAGDRPGVTLVQADASSEAVIEPYLREADVLISLLPAPMMVDVARLAIRYRKPLVYTSYVTPEVRALSEDAEREGVLILGEVGLDPGLDHMTAMRVIRRIEARGGTVTHFISGCGGFPAPDANDNPWGYKFSWSPRAVVMAARNDARFIKDGRVELIAGRDLFAHRWRYAVEGQGVLEMYANRDSTVYANAYGLRDVQGFIRATVRYPGWSATMHAAAMLGLFDLEPATWPEGTTYADLVLRRLPRGDRALPERVADFVGVDPDSEVITRLEWAGFFSDRPIGTISKAPLDIFVDRLYRIMRYRPGERDMVVMQHDLRAEFPDGRTEHVTSTLVRLGEAWGDSAMSQTVSYSAASAARLVCEGEIRAQGVRIPISGEIREPVLDELEERGIAVQEQVRTTYPTPFTRTTDGNT